MSVVLEFMLTSSLSLLTAAAYITVGFVVLVFLGVSAAKFIQSLF